MFRLLNLIQVILDQITAEHFTLRVEFIVVRKKDLTNKDHRFGGVMFIILGFESSDPSSHLSSVIYNKFLI